MEFLLLNALKGSRRYGYELVSRICSGLSNHVRRDICSAEIFEGERGRAKMLSQTYIKRQPVIQGGNLIIDPQCCTVLLESETISLYPQEFDVLLLLAQYPGWVFSSEQIYETVWNECVAGCEHVVYNVICQLRRKLKNLDLIQTVVGRGYKFAG